jgi:hypothetical protein
VSALERFVVYQAENVVHADEDARLEWECLIAEMCDEDAQLRELVRWMYVLMDESCAVQHPYAPAPISYDRLMQAQARACELGVEVSA